METQGNNDSTHPAKTGMKSTIIGIIANACLVVIKGVAGFVGNSYALIADAIESSSDIFSSLIVWTGLKIAKKPADKEHPYGHGKAEPLAATVVSLMLFGAAILIAVQSIGEIKTPHHAPAPFTLAVLVVVVVTKELLFRHVFSVGAGIKSTAVKTDAWHHRSDAITSAFAAVGIAVALIGGKGYESADDWAALAATFIIAYNAYRLSSGNIAELMDTAISPEIERQVYRVARKVKDVASLEKCHVRKIGFDYYVDLHVRVDSKITVNEGHRISHKVKEAVLKTNPRISNVLIHIEPAKK